MEIRVDDVDILGPYIPLECGEYRKGIDQIQAWRFGGVPGGEREGYPIEQPCGRMAALLGVTGGSVTGGSVTGGSVTGGSVTGGSVTGGSVTGDSVTSVSGVTLTNGSDLFQ